MKVEQLIEFLEEMDPDAEVRVAYQPNYPISAPVDTIREVDGVIYIRQAPGMPNNYAPEDVYVEL